MGTTARRTCDSCGVIRPVSDMKQVEKEERAGRSGYSFGVTSKGRARYSSGRTYYKTRRIWQCRNSVAHGDPDYYRRKEREAAERNKARAARSAAKEREAAERNKARAARAAANAAETKRLSLLSKAVDEITSNQENFEKFSKYALAEYSRSDLYKKEEMTFNTWLQNDFALHSYDYSDYVHDLVKPISNLPGIQKAKAHPNKLTDKLLADKNIHLLAQLGLTKECRQRKVINWSLAISITVIFWDVVIIDRSSTKFADYAALLLIFALFARLTTRKYGRFIKRVRRASKVATAAYINAIEPFIQEFVKSSHIGKEDRVVEILTKKLGKFNQIKLSRNVQYVANEPLPSDTNWKIDEGDSSASHEIILDYTEDEIRKMPLKHLTVALVHSDNFFNTVSYALMLWVAQADGHIAHEELALIRELAEVSVIDMCMLMRLLEFKSAKKVIFTVTRNKFKNEPEKIEELINNLFFVAEADSVIEDSELNEIRSISQELGVPPGLFNEILNQSQERKKQPENAYKPSYVDDIIGELDFGNLD